MTGSLLIKGGHVIDPASGVDAIADVRVTGGQVEAVGNNIPLQKGDIVFDAKDLWVCPGFIDMHAHLRDLGQKDKEDFETGTKAAAAGGYTTVVCMANTEPPVDNQTTLSVVLRDIEKRAQIDVLPVACVTKRMEGLELTNMVELAELGVIAFSDAGRTIANMGVLRRALEYAQLSSKPIISHAEDTDLGGAGIIHEGLKSAELGLAGIPAAAETLAIAREIEIVRQTNAHYHFTNLSCAASVELVRRAKADGLPVTADVTPHHLTLEAPDCYERLGTRAQMNPPVRDAAHKVAVWRGITQGIVDVLGSDHAPHTAEEKAKPYPASPSGMTGVQTLVPIMPDGLAG